MLSFFQKQKAVEKADEEKAQIEQKAYDNDRSLYDEDRVARLQFIIEVGRENSINVDGVIDNLKQAVHRNRKELNGDERWLVYMLNEIMRCQTKLEMAAQYKPTESKVMAKLPKTDEPYLKKGAGKSRKLALQKSTDAIKLKIATISLEFDELCEMIIENKELLYGVSFFFKDKNFLSKEKI